MLVKFLFVATASIALVYSAGSSIARAQTSADFGTPPSGSVPLLFNDRHVYVKPDKVHAGRLIAALVRGSEILVPLRSVFLQMGATVAYDPGTKTATIRSRNVRASVTVGVSQIVIDGMARPLDVPPEIVDGDVLVPIRVLVETLGGYVQYLPAVHAVAIRYVPETAGPVPAPTPASIERRLPVTVAAPTAPAARATVGPGAAIPVGTPQPETYVVVDALVEPKIATNAAPDVTGASGSSFAVAAASEFTIVDVNFDIAAHYEEYQYAHPTGPITEAGGAPVAFEAASLELDRDYDAHLGVQLSPAKYYVDVGYGVEHVAGFPRTSGFGVGIEKLPNLNKHLDFDFAEMYYPNMSGQCSACANQQELAFQRFVYKVGLTYSIAPLFIDAAYQGDVGHGKGIPSDDFTHSAIAAGLGLRF